MFLWSARSLAALVALSLLVVCSKGGKDAAPSAAPGTAATIEGTTTSTATAEGNTSIAANADDLLTSSTFSSAVQITFGST